MSLCVIRSLIEVLIKKNALMQVRVRKYEKCTSSGLTKTLHYFWFQGFKIGYKTILQYEIWLPSNWQFHDALFLKLTAWLPLDLIYIYHAPSSPYSWRSAFSLYTFTSEYLWAEAQQENHMQHITYHINHQIYNSHIKYFTYPLAQPGSESVGAPPLQFITNTYHNS